ncbi:tetratricopeptide repeat protein [Microbulbifer sp. YPW1]|uniref:tetratricopeptide repeat protein n=1 Tax=Microbulbifer sp. YPW1 TaxID=2745199 RepID=UPI001599827F|nr:tetratricopeptide repeat protein [Microbulbifer sp. YPW1]QKX16420.1 tetratricopeptide repeat protein [Microbulbifer sp. YPW1]
MELTPKLLTGLLWWAAVAAPAGAEEPFANGTAAFKDGDYERALAHFEQARQGGQQEASLTYNLGVTLFKLRRYQAAQAQFRQLLDDPEWGEVARLQLGLMAEKQGRPVSAVGYYRTLTDSASPKLRRLALARLSALAQAPGAEPAAAEEGRGLALLSLTSGYDSNAYSLQNELLTDDSVGEDTYTELFAWGQYRLQGTAENGWRLHGFAFGRRYSDLESLNLSSFNLGVSRHIPWQGWLLELGGLAEAASLGGDSVTNELRMVGRMQQSFDSGVLTLAYLPSYFNGAENYRYLDGWRQRFEARWAAPLATLDVDLLYRLDLDSREDLTTVDDGFYSYSPRRQTFGVEAELPLAPGWALNAGSHYRLSHYRGNNRLQDSDGEFKSQARDGNRLRSWIGAEVQLLPRLQLEARIIRTDNDENFDIYSYDKTEASLSVRYVF